MTDAGLYTACATNEVAETCCSAILTVRPGKGKGGEGGGRKVPEQPVCPGGCSQAGALRPEELEVHIPTSACEKGVRLDSQCPGWGRLGQHFCSR